MAKDFNDEIESDPADDEIESDPVIAWLKAQLKLTSARQLGLKYEIDRTVITRNMQRLSRWQGVGGSFQEEDRSDHRAGAVGGQAASAAPR